MTNTRFVEEIIKAFGTGDPLEVTRLLEREIRKERARGHIVVAKRLTNLLRAIPPKTLGAQSVRSTQINASEDGGTLYEKVNSHIPIEETVLDIKARNTISNFLREWEAYDELIKNNIYPTNKLIFYGPPGTGKTKLAYGIAHKLDLPLVIVRLDELISSYLGRTGKNIREIFDIAQKERVIIFLDEIDTIAKHRDDSRELGELKRVVTVLLQNIDSFPQWSILIGATNHHELLDNALWRRFGIKMHIELPSLENRAILFELFFSNFKGRKTIDYRLLAEATEGVSGSHIHDIVEFTKRSSVLDGKAGIDTLDCLRSILSLSHSLFHGQKLDKKNLYQICQKLSDGGLSLKQLEQVSGIPYTTLRDNIKI